MWMQGGRGSVKAPSFIFKKNIKFLILGIDNMGNIVYSLIKIKEIRRNPKWQELTKSQEKSQMKS